MSIMTYLHRPKNSTKFHFRRGVPSEIRAAVGLLLGKQGPVSEVKATLNTTDPKEAKRLAHKKALEVDALFRQAYATATVEQREELSDLEIMALIETWKHDVLEEDDEERMLGVDESGYEKMAETLAIVEAGGKAALARGNTDLIEFELDDLLDRNGINLTKDTPAYRKLAFAMMRASVQLNDLIAKRHQGEAIETPPAPPPIVRKPGQLFNGKGDNLQSVVDRWSAERKPRPQTVQEFETAARRFRELHGDIPIQQITKPLVVAFKDALLQVPRRMSHSLREKTLPEQIELMKGDLTTPRLKATAVKKQLNCLSAILGWAVDNAMIEHNPASGVAVRNPEHEDRTRYSYDLDDLKAITGFPIFTSGDRPTGGKGEASVWLPILALYTGARLTELGQLLVADVRVETGIHFLDIKGGMNEGVEQRVKRKASIRRVPLHPEIIRLGFLDYVTARSKAGDTRVFPELKARPRTGVLTASFSEWWGRYARDNGIKDKRKTFHSFRHSFRDAGRRAGIEEAIQDAIDGRSSGKVGRKYGDAGYPVDVLAQQIAKIKYAGVTFTLAKARK
jgi:integrase